MGRLLARRVSRGHLSSSAAFAVAIGLAACGDGGVPPASSLPPAPPGVTVACREAAKTETFEVRCPTRWPAGGRRASLRSIGVANGYLLETGAGLGERDPVFHVIVGGQRRPFRPGFEGDGRALRVTTRRVAVPVIRGARGGATGRVFISERPTRRVGWVDLHGARGALLRAPAYPQGGIHGGHSIVMWNQGGHGYLVSTHSERSTRTAARMAIALARAMRVTG
jgi:hypothetical protein